MAIVHCFIALVTLTPQVPHLVRTLHAGKWLALLALGQIAGCSGCGCCVDADADADAVDADAAVLLLMLMPPC